MFKENILYIQKELIKCKTLKVKEFFIPGYISLMKKYKFTPPQSKKENSRLLFPPFLFILPSLTKQCCLPLNELARRGSLKI